MENNQLRNVQLIELDILATVVEICEKYNLRYYIIGGTCLGALRHKGFIPWDDDIDVGMPRSDYNRFLEIAHGELKQNLFLQTYKTDNNYLFSFAKVRNTETTFIEESVKHLNMNHGIYIDIFPLDGVPDHKFVRAIKITCIKFWHNLLCLKLIPEYKFGEKIGKFIKVLLAWIPKQMLNERIDKLCSKKDYNSSRYVANFLGSWGKREIVPQFFFGSGTTIEFEGIKVKGPEHYDSYMTAIYGNYMKLPPVEKRVTVHETTVIDDKNSYKKYFVREN